MSKQIPDVAPKVKCGFCGKVMDVSEWSMDAGKGGHQGCHGGTKKWEYTPAQIARRAERRNGAKGKEKVAAE